MTPADTLSVRSRPLLLAAGLALLALAGGPAQAQERHGPHGYGAPGWRFDDHYHHDHYYPARGYVTGVLPNGSISVGFGGGHYFFHGGVWFRPVGPRFVVVTPPLGIIVPVLPPDVTTVWLGGVPYYYANGVYYGTAPGGYAVVQPPPGAEAAQPVPPPPPPKPAPDPIIYPRNGQSAQQIEEDRRECNRWATTQPTAMADASVFQRAVLACMDGRGYTLK